MGVLVCVVLLGSYTVKVSILDEFGTKVSSSNYDVWGAGGQSSVIGDGTSETYRTRYGFFGYFSRMELGIEESENLPLVTALYGIRPNPSHGAVNIDYTIAENGYISLKIYDIAGRMVKVLKNGRVKAGEYHVGWNCTNVDNRALPAGVYFYRLVVDGKPIATKKLVIVR